MTRNDYATLAQRMREYIMNPHHIDPVSDGFRSLIDEATAAFSALAQTAENHQGEPVALPERKREFTDNGTPLLENLSWNACLDEIAKLGPLYSWPVQGEPYGCMMFPVGRREDEFFVSGVPDVSRPDAHGEMWELIPLYTHADPGEVERSIERRMEMAGEKTELYREVERLRGELDAMTKLYSEACQASYDFGSMQTKLAERAALLQIINRKATEYACASIPTGRECRFGDEIAALSASAETSAPVEIDNYGPIAWHVGGNGYDRICFDRPGDLPGHPAVNPIPDLTNLLAVLQRFDLRNETPVEIDERAEFEKHYASKNDGFVPSNFDGEYDWHDAQPCWEAWKARAALEKKS